MNPKQFFHWLEKKSQLDNNNPFLKPLIMGVLNVTSDSFFDGGKFLLMDRACEHAFDLVAQGADVLDIGGESTQPGAESIPIEIELKRVIPVIEHIRAHSDICISIDTYKPEVMKAAVEAGANIINDVYALRNKGALEIAAQLGVPVCLMHMQGQPETMQKNPQYPSGVMNELVAFFEERIKACEKAGINRKQLILDPGFGFGKRVSDNLNIIYNINKLHGFNLPLLLGVSRKSTIGAVLNKEVNDRLVGSLSISVYAALNGVGIFRTHDVNETKQALDMIDAIEKNGLAD